MSVSCPSPLDFERITAYLLGELDESDQNELEEHLFGCAACTAAAEAVQGLTAGLAELLPPVIAQERLQRLREAGARILETEIRPGENPETFFAEGLDFMIHKLVAGPRRAARVDVEILNAARAPLARFEAVPFDPGKGAVYIACQRYYRELGYPDDLYFRVVEVGDETRCVLGEFGVRHRWPG